ncbi:hypothetical protein CLOP_g10755 [Closterium sp. NIES-67]|nr:hypothetical protein CLOP_g10755 [Closterium sp. NIES-67]
MGKKRVKRELAFYEANGKRLEPGLCVMLRPPSPKTPPYIARIERIECDAANRVKMWCRWYYRPEESMEGRRQFHGVKELFLSDHYDGCYPEAVESLCSVHSLKEYAYLSAVEEEDFFCRFEYNASTGVFAPERVAVYCKCEMPYNPDNLMVQCEDCKDWFHPECVNLPIHGVESMSEFICPDCS